MKPLNLLLLVFAAGLLASCAPNLTTYYQIYKTSNEGLQKKDKLLTYTDENCEVSYNLWSNGGYIGFRFYNKTDQNIYLNMDECYYILNGNAHNYYKNRIYTYSAGAGVGVSSGISVTNSTTAVSTVTGYTDYYSMQTNSIASNAIQSVYSTVSLMASKGYSVAYNEEKIVCIPPKTSKVIAEYSINETVYRDCDLLRFPSVDETAVKTFTKSNSPFVFSNQIVYKVGQNVIPKKIENEFYVREISNLSVDNALKLDYSEFCGEKSWEQTYFFKEVAADQFYVEYRRPSTYYSRF